MAGLAADPVAPGAQASYLQAPSDFSSQGLLITQYTGSSRTLAYWIYFRLGLPILEKCVLTQQV